MTSAPIAAPRPNGSRPSRRTVVTVRGLFFAFWPPPLARAAFIYAGMIALYFLARALWAVDDDQAAPSSQTRAA